MKTHIGLNRHTILEIAIMLYLAQLLFPLPFRHLPFPLYSNFFYSALVFAAFAILYPKSYISKGLLVFYVFIFVRLFFAPLLWSKREYGFEGSRINIKSTVIGYYPLFIAILVYFHYINKKDYYTLGRICKRALILSLFGVVNSFFVFREYPQAMIEYVIGEVRGTLILVEKYKSLGLLGYGFFNALCSIFPVFIYMIKKTNIYISKKIWWFLLALISWITITLTNTTAFLLFSTIFVIVAWILRPDYKKDIYILIALLLVVIIIPSSFTAQIFYRSSEYFPESKIGKNLYDAGLTIENPDIDYYSSTQHAGMRLGRIPLLWRSFLSDPFIGGGYNSEHVAWLDMLSMFGLLGFLPWLWFVIDNYKRNLKIIYPTYIPYYMLCVIAFVAMGFLKNTGGAHIWIFWFLIAPGACFIYIHNNSNKYLIIENNE